MAVALDRPVISLIGYTNPKRTGPYRRFHDLVVDAYGDPGESYPISMENRLDRMQRIGVRDVLDVRRSVARVLCAGGERSEVVAESERAAEPHEAVERQTHHGEVVAVHTVDDRRAESLDAVGARPCPSARPSRRSA